MNRDDKVKMKVKRKMRWREEGVCVVRYALIAAEHTHTHTHIHTYSFILKLMINSSVALY